MITSTTLSNFWIFLKFHVCWKIHIARHFENILSVILIYLNYKLCLKKYSKLTTATFVKKSNQIDDNYHQITYATHNNFCQSEFNAYQKETLLSFSQNCWHVFYVTYCEEPDVAVVSAGFYFSLFGDDRNRKPAYFLYRPLVPLKLHTAHTVHISEIKDRLLTKFDSKCCDDILKDYFKNPILVTKNDILTIDSKQYSTKVSHCTWHSDEFLKKSYNFRILNVFGPDGTESNVSHFCVLGVTNLKQVADSQFFRPSDDNSIPDFLTKLREIIFDNVQCFLNVDTFSKTTEILKPVFKLNGERGSGKRLLMKNFANSIGFHLHQLECSYFQSMNLEQIQHELKLIFTNIRCLTPCVLQINDFELFGKNGDGSTEYRLVDVLQNQIELLFQKNYLNYPLLIFCLVNDKVLVPELNRLFIDTFTIADMTSDERTNTLRWLLKERKVCFMADDIESISARAYGFLLSDLSALICKARAKSVSNNALTIDDLAQALDEMQVSFNRSIGAPKVPKIYWDDIGGLDELKAEIIRSINLPLRCKSWFKARSFKRSGILLHGPPGTGKTLIAKAVATENNFCFLSVKGPELLNMYVGQSEQNIREIFTKARQASPCIIFFDELDSLIPRRGNLGDSSGVMDRLSSQMLTEMDRLTDDKFVFVIGATNRLDLIDTAFLRPGRFDKVLYVGYSNDLDSKVKILTALAKRFKMDDVNITKIAEMCPVCISGADLYSICSNAWMSSVRRLIKNQTGSTEVVVTMKDFMVAVNDFKAPI